MKIIKWLVTILVIVGCVVAVKVVKHRSFKARLKPAPVKVGARIKGAVDAKLRIQEFTDFQCPSCSKVLPVMDDLLKKYNGRISFQHKYFPLPTHKHATKASIYAECASGQNKFWPYHDLLFGKQAEWSDLDDPSGYFEDLAMQVNMNMDKFKACLSGKEAGKRVGSDKLDGEILGIRATPTFVIEGKLFVGGQNLKNELESRLDK